jgi:hypothetical protein
MVRVGGAGVWVALGWQFRFMCVSVVGGGFDTRPVRSPAGRLM